MSAHRHLFVLVALSQVFSPPTLAFTPDNTDVAAAGAGAASLGASAILGRRARSVRADAMSRVVPRPSELMVQSLTNLDDPSLRPEPAADVEAMRRGFTERIPGVSEDVNRVWTGRRFILDNVYDRSEGTYFVIDDEQTHSPDDFLTPEKAERVARVLRTYEPGSQIQLKITRAVDIQSVDELDINGYSNYLEGMTFKTETAVFNGPPDRLAMILEAQGDSRIVDVSVQIRHPDQVIQHPPMSAEQIAAINQGIAERNEAREAARRQIIAANEQIRLENESARAAHSEQMAAFERTLAPNQSALARASRLRTYSRLAGGAGAGLIGLVIVRNSIGQAHAMDHSQDPRTQRLLELARESAAARAAFRAQTRPQANGRH